MFNHCGPDAGTFEGVQYLDLARDWTRWRAEVRANRPDVLVLFRRMLDVVTDIPSRFRVFWAHDHQGVYRSDPPSVSRALGIVWRRSTGRLFHDRVHRVFVVSQFMADLFRWLYRTPREKLVVMPNGINGLLFRDLQAEHSPMRFVHSSVPKRGLAQLLKEIFPEIRKAHPGAELHLFSYQSLHPYRQYADGGVHFHGWVPKENLIQALGQSSLMLYPANFEEMGAISVLESMAAGTPAVMSTLGVLSELAGVGRRGIAVAGAPGTPAFARRFIEETLKLLEQTTRLEQMRQAAREYALEHHDWDAIIRRWDMVLRDLVSGT